MKIQMMIYSMLVSLATYVSMSLAIYKIAKIQNQNKPWIAWIPIGNIYMLIKITKSPMLFIIPPVILFFTAGFNNLILLVVTVVLTIAMVGTTLYMYKKLCNRYDSPFWPIVVGMVPALFFLNIYGQWKLYNAAIEDEINPNKMKIRSEVRFREKKSKK